MYRCPEYRRSRRHRRRKCGHIQSAPPGVPADRRRERPPPEPLPPTPPKPEEVLGTVSCPIPPRRILSSLRFWQSRSGSPLPEGIVSALSVSSRSEPIRLYIKSARPPMASGFDSGSVSLLGIIAD